MDFYYFFFPFLLLLLSSTIIKFVPWMTYASTYSQELLDKPSLPLYSDRCARQPPPDKQPLGSSSKWKCIEHLFKVAPSLYTTATDCWPKGNYATPALSIISLITGARMTTVDSLTIPVLSIVSPGLTLGVCLWSCCPAQPSMGMH